MFSFMFGVLGSVVTWIIYLPIGFVVGALVFKKLCPTSWGYFSRGCKTRSRDHGDPCGYWSLAMFWTFVCLFIWPIVVGTALLCICVKFVMSKAFTKALVAAGNCIPEIHIGKGKQED